MSVVVLDPGADRERRLRDEHGLADRLISELPICRIRLEDSLPRAFGFLLEHLLDRCGLTPQRFECVSRGERWEIAFSSRSGHAAESLARGLDELFRPGSTLTLDGLGERAMRIARDTDLGASTRLILAEAGRRGIPWFRLDEGSMLQLGYGRERRLINGTETQLTSSVSVDLSCDKALTKRILSSAQIAVPHGLVASSAEEALEALSKLAPPLALKPLSGNHGHAVYLGIQTEEEIREAFPEASRLCGRVVVEECFSGRDYRVVVVGGRLAAACERRPAEVVGDGSSAIYELIDRENDSPLRGDGHDYPLHPIDVDPVLLACLRRSGRSLANVPAAGERVILRDAANLSRGGTARDVTDEVHPAVERVCVRAAAAIGLDVCGIDLVMPSISQPIPARAGIIEVNASPGISMHHTPSEGRERDVAGAIVDLIFPAGDGRIPVISVSGLNGKTTTVRMIARILSGAGRRVGAVSSDGISIGGESVREGGPADADSARCVLSDPSVDTAVLESAWAEIARGGLGYDLAEIGVITGLASNGSGLAGLDPERQARLEELAAERVRDGGTLVLNAEDAGLTGLLGSREARAWRKQLVLCALRPDDPRAIAQRLSGGAILTLDSGRIIEEREGRSEVVMPASAIPATIGGRAEFQVLNAMFAIAACRGLGLSLREIADSLGSFGRGSSNRGRANLYKLKGGHAVVDHGRNPNAFAALSGLASRIEASRRTCVFGMPGESGEGDMLEGAAMLGKHFERLIVRECLDPCRRKRGEAAQILAGAAGAASPGHACSIVLDEAEALRRAFGEMIDGELIVIFYDQLRSVENALAEFAAERLEAPLPSLGARGMRVCNSDVIIERAPLVDLHSSSSLDASEPAFGKASRSSPTDQSNPS